jgi:hypothetical protein
LLFTGPSKIENCHERLEVELENRSLGAAPSGGCF